MTLNTYLYFSGNCREAFELYRSVFGGEFQIMQTFGDGPPEMDIPEGEHDNIMHVSYPIGSSVLMGSDIPTNFGPPMERGSNFAISYSAKSREEADDLFAKISESGAVTMPLGDQFWGGYFGSCTDRFGINWQFNYEAPRE